MRSDSELLSLIMRAVRHALDDVLEDSVDDPTGYFVVSENPTPEAQSQDVLSFEEHARLRDLVENNIRIRETEGLNLTVEVSELSGGMKVQ